jgi:hypothetical protein
MLCDGDGDGDGDGGWSVIAKCVLSRDIVSVQVQALIMNISNDDVVCACPAMCPHNICLPNKFLDF